MENRTKVMCVKKCISSTYNIANVGDLFYINVPSDDSLSEIEILLGFYKIFPRKPPMELYKRYNLSIIDNLNINININKGYFDARNFITPAEFRENRIDEILTDEITTFKLLN